MLRHIIETPRSQKKAPASSSKTGFLSKRRFSIPIIILLIVIGFFGWRQYTIRNEREVFKTAESQLTSFQNAVQVKFEGHNVDNGEAKKYCQPGHGKFESSGIYCFIEIKSVINDIKNEPSSRQVSDIAINLARTNGIIPFTRFDATETTSDWQGSLGSRAANNRLSCSEEYKYTTADQTLTIVLSCNTQVTQPMYILLP